MKFYIGNTILTVEEVVGLGLEGLKELVVKEGASNVPDEVLERILESAKNQLKKANPE